MVPVQVVSDSGEPHFEKQSSWLTNRKLDVFFCVVLVCVVLVCVVLVCVVLIRVVLVCVVLVCVVNDHQADVDSRGLLQ